MVFRSLSGSDASEAKIAVTVVPMFAPSVSGYILLMCSTPTPTSGVMAEVKMELLCTSMVSPAPMKMAR